jgi:hypothetical protein
MGNRPLWDTSRWLGRKGRRDTKQPGELRSVEGRYGIALELTNVLQSPKSAFLGIDVLNLLVSLEQVHRQDFSGKHRRRKVYRRRYRHGRRSSTVLCLIPTARDRWRR